MRTNPGGDFSNVVVLRKTATISNVPTEGSSPAIDSTIGTSGEMRWDVAPVLTLTPINASEIAGGYRLGDLRDPDFASNGGQGWFVTLQLRVTESNPIVDYWRNRMRSTMARRGETP